MNTNNLTADEAAAFRRLVVSDGPALLATLGDEEKVIFGTTVAFLLGSESALQNGPRTVAGSTMTGATKAALFALFDKSRSPPTKDNKPLIAVFVVTVLIGAALTYFLSGE